MMASISYTQTQLTSEPARKHHQRTYRWSVTSKLAHKRSDGGPPCNHARDTYLWMLGYRGLRSVVARGLLAWRAAVDLAAPCLEAVAVADLIRPDDAHEGEIGRASRSVGSRSRSDLGLCRGLANSSELHW